MAFFKKSENSDRSEAMAKAPLFPLMLSMGIPTFIAQLINLLYNIVDRVYIGHIAESGAMALTGVGICFPIITLISAFASFAGAGGAPLAGIALGAGKKEEAERILGNSAGMLFALAVVLTLVFQAVKRPFLFAFGASEVTYAFARQYMEIYLCGTIFVMITMGLNTYIMIQGETTTAMKSILIGAVCNIILDPVFIFGLGMGVRGAALATVLSQSASAAWILRILTGKERMLRLRPGNIRLQPATMVKIAALGISPMIMNSTESLISIVFNRSAQIYGGDLYVGSITILQSAMQIVFVPMSGFIQGVQPIVSFNYGARNYKRVKEACKKLLFISWAGFFLVSGCFILLPGQAAGVFTDDVELIGICRKMLPVFMAGMPIFGFQCASQFSFMALGKTRESLFFALLRKVFLLIPLALILPMVTGSVIGLYVAEPVSDIISAISCVTVFVWNMKKLDEEGDV